MEMTTQEASVLQKVEDNVKELDELELAMIGGGVGDVILG